jgi:hypothetical protein
MIAYKMLLINWHIAFVVDKAITCAQIENGIKEACDYVTDVTLFDVYEGIQLGPDKWHGLGRSGFPYSYTPPHPQHRDTPSRSTPQPHISQHLNITTPHTTPHISTPQHLNITTCNKINRNGK